MSPVAWPASIRAKFLQQFPVLVGFEKLPRWNLPLAVTEARIQVAQSIALEWKIDLWNER